MPAPAPPQPRHAAAAFAALALIVGISCWDRWEPYSFLRNDASFYATITRGLATDLSLDQRRWQPASWYSGKHPVYRNLDMAWSNVSIGIDGSWYPKHSYVMPLLATPFYALFGPAGLLLFNALATVLMLWAGYLIAARYAPGPAAMAAIVVAAFAPKIHEHTYHFSLDTFSAAVTALGFAALLGRRAVAAGLLFGVAIWTRFTLAALIVPVGVAMIWGLYSRREWLRLFVAGSVPLTLMAIANTVMYGAPWLTSYDTVLTVENGQPMVQSVRTLFDVPASEGWEKMINAGYAGIDPTLPATYLSVYGLVPLLLRQWKLAIALALAVGAFVGFFIDYRHFSARFFIAWYILLCTPLAVLMADAGRLSVWLARAADRLLRPREPRLRKRIALGLAGVGGLALLVAWLLATPTWRLSDHVGEAEMTRNGVTCDYFNMRHQKWECSGADRKDWQLVGRAVREQCRFEGAEGPRVYFHAPRPNIRKRLVWPDIPAGELVMTYGMPDTAKPGETCVEVRYGRGDVRTLCAETPGEVLTATLPAPEGPLARLEVRVRPEGATHRVFCFDGEIALP